MTGTPEDAANTNIGNGDTENSADGAQTAEGQNQDSASAQASPNDLAAEYLDALQRERASFINFRRRVEQERTETAQYAAANVLKKLLPIVDDFDRALQSIPENERKHNKWVAGVELIERKLHNLLEQEGVEPIEALGQPFDPNTMEAVAFEDNTGEGNQDHTDTVSQVFSNGYKLRDRVLRPAMVKVSRG